MQPANPAAAAATSRVAAAVALRRPNLLMRIIIIYWLAERKPVRVPHLSGGCSAPSPRQLVVAEDGRALVSAGKVKRHRQRTVLQPADLS